VEFDVSTRPESQPVLGHDPIQNDELAEGIRRIQRIRRSLEER
jgi:hypothetical protein